MPYDSADQSLLPINSESHTPVQSGSGRGILAQMKDAGRSLVHSVKRKATTKVLAAFMVAGAALLGPQTAKGQDVVAVITGTVSSGTDTTGVFGAPGSLTGEPFTLTLPIDSSKGTQTSSTCGYGEYYSNISLSSFSAPVTAILEIGSGGGKFDFGGGAPVYSYAMRYSQPCYYSVAGYGVQVNYTTALYGTAYVGNTSGPNVWAVPWTTGILSPSADWSYPIASAAANTAYPFPFSISITLGGLAYKAASGSLAPATLTVSGNAVYGVTNGDPGDTSTPGNPISPMPFGGPGTGPSNPYQPFPTIVGPSYPSHSGGLPTPASTTPNADCGCGGEVGSTGQTSVGEPINPGTGNVFQKVTDYTTVGTNALSFMRYYNSKGNASQIANLLVVSNATSLGTNWRSNYDRYLQVVSSTSVNVERPDGQVLNFVQSGGVWTTNTDVDAKLTQSGSAWAFTDHNDTVENYTVAGSTGILQSIAYRNGYTQTMAYTSGQLTTVTDSYTRTLSLTYTSGMLNTVTPPDGPVLTYAFNASGHNGSSLDRLASVSYSTSPVTNQTYLYENGGYPFALTGITDENGNRYNTWAYDNYGRGISSEFGSGAGLTTLSYGSGTTTVTNALGVVDTYTFTTLQGVPKVTQISRAATATTAAATRTFTYDTNGYLSSQTDWNGNVTNYVNNSRGQPTSVTEAYGTAAARTTTITYDSTFVHLPDTVTTSGLTTTYSYDSSGNVLTKTDSDTTTNSVPYSTNGQTRATTFTWSGTGQELTAQLPRTDVTAKTTFAYASDGALTSVTDALTHATSVTSHSNGGLLLTIVDPNSVTTTITYDGRLRLNTSTLHRGAGNLVTTWTHDAAGNLTSFEQPDGSTLSYAYDTAHRLTTVTDLPGNSINYTLDALGDRTATQVKNTGGTVKESHSATFDALGRALTDVGGMSQTTTFTYDANGNALTISNPLSNTVTKTYDALNRLSTSVDPSPGATTTIAYDAHNRPTSITDANGNATTYVYNGFGDRTQTASPDSGTTVFHYDPDRNLTQKVLPGSMTMNATFDALDRPLTNAYPSDTTLNVSRTYDQTSGHGFGVGRLTSATDQPGSLSLTYDERGNVTGESRTVTSAGTLAASTTFDGANNISSITYPSGTVVNYTRNSMGLVTSITAQPPGAGSPSNVVTSITYEPFGPETGLTFGNGITGTYSYDADYRPTSRVDAASSNVLSLAYTYFSNNSVHVITDSVNSANSQTLGYDALDRLTSAVSGGGGYGTWSWTWDPVDNVQTQVINGTTTTLSQTSGTNILSQFVTSGTTTTVASTGTGNINTLTVGGTPVDTFTYNQANQLASATSTSSNASYKYDLDGQRIEKSPPGVYPVLYQYGQAAKELLSENDLHSGTTADYIYLNGRSIGQVNPTSGNLYFTHTDMLGTINTITDSSKSLVWSAIYNPFGDNPIAGVSGTLTTQSLRLPGQAFDVESGLNHNGFRDYAGTLTRYIESDPIGLKGGTNTFQYANGNPFKNIDPSGTDVYVVNTGQVGGYHQKIVVGNPFGNQYGQSFGLPSRDTPQQSPWQAYGGQTGPGVPGSGVVYPDSDPIAQWGPNYLKTTPYEDSLIQHYLESQRGDTGPYNLFTNNCRDYSQDQFDKIVQMVWKLRWGP